MNRRRFVFGLGAAVVASSTAALTGATLSSAVQPTADFRVNVDGGTEVKAATSNPTFDSREVPGVGAGLDGLSGGFPSPEAHEFGKTFGPTEIPAAAEAGRSADFTYALEDAPGTGAQFGTVPDTPRIAANDGVNDGFELALNVGLPAEDAVFNAPTAVAFSNNASAAVDLAVSYSYGPAVEETPLTQADVADIYRFVDPVPGGDTTTRVSPSSNDPTGSGTAVTLGPGETYLIDVDVHLDFTAAEGDNIRTLIDDQIGPEGGELQLLDAIEVGTPT